MKKLIIVLVTLMSVSAVAETLSVLCGKGRLRVGITATREDMFSDPTITGVTVDGSLTKYRGAKVEDKVFDIYGFGYKGYESIKATINSCNDGRSIVGSAVYTYYNSANPMNPMTKTSLDCACAVK